MRTSTWIVLLATTTLSARAAEPASLAKRVEAVMARPALRHALLGVEIYSLTARKVLYAHEADRLFAAASVTKLVTVGAALRLLGPDYRFHTRVYRTGPLSDSGVVEGDIVLVAGGDPNLSGRRRPDGTLAFENTDHSLGHVTAAALVPGDPLAALRDLAGQVAARGVKQVRGRVLVDASLFPEGAKEAGTGVVISPFVVNDNIIDVVVTPGKTPGDKAAIEPVPPGRYAAFEGQVKTGAAEDEAAIEFAAAAAAGDTLRVTVRGTVPAGAAPRPFPFAVPRPARFAQVTFADLLRAAGVEVSETAGTEGGAQPPADPYPSENLLADWVSAPYAEDAKITLKVSQNLHAAMLPYLLGALLDGAGDGSLDAGFARERGFLAKAGLDLTAVSQSAGEGDALFTPDFLTRFLALMAEHDDGGEFVRALPILGRDGTLWHTGVGSPAAGRLRAKTGTQVEADLLNQTYFTRAKALAGYLDAADGSRLVVVVLANHVPASADIQAIGGIGDLLADIATAAYVSAPATRSSR